MVSLLQWIRDTGCEPASHEMVNTGYWWSGKHGKYFTDEQLFDQCMKETFEQTLSEAATT